MVDPKQLGSLPSEIFADFMDTIEEDYHQDKKKLKEILRDLNFSLTPDISFENFLENIKKHEKFNIIHKNNYKFLYEEFIEKVQKEEKKKQKDEERAKKKLISKFIDLLESVTLKPYSKWEEVLFYLIK